MAQKIKILRITTIAPSMKILLKGQNRFLSNNNFEVFASSSESNLSKKEIEEIGASKYYHLPLTRKITPFQDIFAILRCMWLIKKLKPQIVHTYTPKAGLVGMIAAWFLRVPVRIHSVGGLPLMEVKGFKYKILVLIEKLIYACASRVIINSKGLFNYIHENISTNSKVKVIGNGSTNGIDGNDFKINDKISLKAEAIKSELGLNKSDFIWIYIGRVVKDKGINELLEVFDKLSKTNSDMKLLIVGNLEEDLDPITHASKQILKLNSNIKFVGFQNDVRPYLAASNCLIFPSYREGLPNVPMQAACFNLPIIATNINGCNEIIIEGENGILIPTKNIIELHTAMERVFFNSDLRLKFTKSTRNIVLSKFSQETVWQNLLKEYQDLIKSV